MAKFFRFPWATQGDKVSTPDALQSDGSASWLQGFGFDYERPNTDASYKPIPRDGMNGLFHDLSEAIGELQRQGVPSYMPEAAPYVGGAIVRHAGANWLSTADENTTEPGAIGSKWARFGAGVDVGDVKTVATETAPYGWLKCNGEAISRSEYPALFGVISTRYGAGDGTSTFNLPDLRGEFVRGWDDGRGVDAGRELGSVQDGQNALHTHEASTELAGGHRHEASSDSAGSHAHSGGTTAAGGHQHGVYAGGQSNIGGYQGTGIGAGDYVSQTALAGAHAHEFSTNTAGGHAHAIYIGEIGGHSHAVTVNASGGSEARPRNISLLYVIKY